MGRAPGVRGGQRRFATLTELLVEPVGQGLCQAGIIALHVELKVQTQAARVPIRRSHQGPAPVHDEHLRMVERWRTEPEAAAVFQELPPVRGGPVEN
jgi:hypothetical protein